MKNNIIWKITLYEGVLNDDYISIDEKGIIRLIYYTFASTNSNDRHEKIIKNIIEGINLYKKEFPNRVKEQGEYWMKESDANDYTPEEFWNEVVQQ